jgi:hypothetical protein
MMGFTKLLPAPERLMVFSAEPPDFDWHPKAQANIAAIRIEVATRCRTGIQLL